MEIRVIFESKLRDTFPDLNSGSYKPYLVFSGNNGTIPVTFISSELNEFDLSGIATISYEHKYSYNFFLRIGASFEIAEGNKMVGHGTITSFDDTKINPLFSNVHKGKVYKEEYICWDLGGILLKFIDEVYEYQVRFFVKRRIFKKEKYVEISHLHLLKDEIDSFIQEVDNPNKKIRIGHFLGGCSFAFVDKDEKKIGCYYSE